MSKLDELTEALYAWITEAGIPTEQREELVEKLLELIDEELDKVDERQTSSLEED